MSEETAKEAGSGARHSAESDGGAHAGVDQMPFLSHLGELRRRLAFAVAALGIGFGVCFTYSEEIFRHLTLPLNNDLSFVTSWPFVLLTPKASGPTQLIFLGPAENFWVHMKVSAVAATALAFPIIMHQLWRFVAPGLFEKERRLALPFIIVSSGLFLLGAAFCFYIVLPFAMGFLMTYKTATLTPMLSVERYMDFCLKFILAFGVVFELPVVIVFLTRMGIVTPRTLSRNRKYAVLIAFVVAAMLTPTPDAFNQLLMAVPIIVLYEVGILASLLVNPRRKTGGETG